MIKRPECSGEWVGGSGGHRRHTPCDKEADWWYPGDMHAYCDEHFHDTDIDYFRWNVENAALLNLKEAAIFYKRGDEDAELKQAAIDYVIACSAVIKAADALDKGCAERLDDHNWNQIREFVGRYRCAKEE